MIKRKAVQDRLRISGQALEAALKPNPQRIQKVYRQRAARLASTELNRKAASPGLSVLIFRLGPERYAIEMNELAEVLPFARCVAVPGTSRQFMGVINVRGELRAVLDLGHVLVSSDRGIGEKGFVLMLRRTGKEIGLKVDHIEDLREIRPEELTLSTQGNYGKGLISGALVLVSVDAVLGKIFTKEESLKV